MRGRKPKPPHLKLVTGNPGRRPVNPGLRPGAEAPKPPPGINKLALAVWKETVPLLLSLGVLAKIDKNQIAAYCGIEARRRKNQAILDKHDSDTYETDGKGGRMTRIRAEVKIVEQCEKALKSYAVEWGMTGSSRARMGDPNQGDLFKDDPTAGAV